MLCSLLFYRFALIYSRNKFLKFRKKLNNLMKWQNYDSIPVQKCINKVLRQTCNCITCSIFVCINKVLHVCINKVLHKSFQNILFCLPLVYGVIVLSFSSNYSFFFWIWEVYFCCKSMRNDKTTRNKASFKMQICMQKS